MQVKNRAPVEVREWQRSEIEQQLHTTFRCGAADLELTEVTSLGSPTSPASGQPFSCLFAGDLEAGQGTFRLEHEILGATELFLVPLGPREGLMVFEAVFN